MLDARPSAADEVLSELSTHWVDLERAHGLDVLDRLDAQGRVFLRYERAILRYVRVALPDRTAAEEVVSDFFAKFLDGRFRNASPDRGRFRDYVKSTLFRMVKDFHRKRTRGPAPLPDDVAGGDSPGAEMEARFVEYWRENLMLRAWDALEELERWNGRPYATVLADSLPGRRLRSREIAASLSARDGRTVTEDWVRAVRKEARDALEDFVLAEAWASMADPTADRVEEELVDLGLLVHLKKAIDRRARGQHRRPAGVARRASPRSDNPGRSAPTPLDSATSALRS